MTFESMKPNNVANDPIADIKNRSGESPLSALKFVATLGQITVILMRTPQHRHGLDWCRTWARPGPAGSARA